MLLEILGQHHQLSETLLRGRRVTSDDDKSFGRTSTKYYLNRLELEKIITYMVLRVNRHRTNKLVLHDKIHEFKE